MAHFIAHHEEVQPGADLRGFLQAQVGRYHDGVQLPPEDQIGGEVRAYVNQGRWIAECPSGDGFAIVASRDRPIFMCAVCVNGKAGGKWLAVVYPADKARIEHELLKRQAAHPILAAPTRNWRPGETVVDLVRENAREGVV